MFCTSCGQELDAEDKFCRRCGAPVPAQVEEPPRAEEGPAEDAGSASAVPPFVQPSHSTAEMHQPLPVVENVAPVPSSEAFAETETPAPPSVEAIAPTTEPSLVQEEIWPAQPLETTHAAPPSTAHSEVIPQDLTAPSTSAEVIAPTPEPSPAQEEIWPAQPPETTPAAPPPTAYSKIIPRYLAGSSTSAPPARRTMLEKVLILLVAVLVVGIGVVIWMLRSPAPNTTPAVAVRLDPTTAQVAAGEGMDFTATVSGSSNVEVSWRVQEGDSGGRIVSRGAHARGGKVSLLVVYVAPSNPGTYHVIATSQADHRASATATIKVTPR